MQIRHLENFLFLAETLNFRQAAARSKITQSSLSQQIAKLEQQMGTALFTRTTRSVRLTAAGELFVPLASRILASVDDAQAQLDALQARRRGRLRLGLLDTHGDVGGLLEVLALFHSRNSAIEMNVTTASGDQNAEGVRAGTLDLAQVDLGRSVITSEMKVIALASVPFVLLVPANHALAAEETVELADLSPSEQMVQCLHGPELQSHIDAILLGSGRDPRKSLVLNDMLDVNTLVARGVGVAVIPYSAALEGVQQEDVCAVRLGTSAVYTTGLCYDPNRLSAAAEEFLRIVARLKEQIS
ncbi:LysR family transcriptional regulator (plasmid) [Streptomyces sp. AHU1]|uniref:LysR family transcriptional regulator n=1 Tax=Streptomyces sp. AHU1 TaxID=3377215 RepID=UPI003877F61D